MNLFVSPLDTSPLVGRGRELATLRRQLEVALAGRGSLVLISGEAGVGKTALAETLCREAEEHGARVLIGRCYDLTETPPYGPWVELFGRYRPAGALPPPPEAFARRGTVGEIATQSALLDQVLDFFADLARVTPLVVLFDDLHWADPVSLDLLRVLARAATSLPLLLLATYRPDAPAGGHTLAALLPALVRESAPLRIDLMPLSPDAVRSLVASRYALSPAEEASLTAYLGSRAEGNALFTVELLHTLEERRVIQITGGVWRLGDLASVAVPTLLRQVIEARTARLGEGARRAVSIAAVIGQEVPLALWAAIAGLGEDALIDVVEQAAAARLMDTLPDGSGCRFVHALIREALYEGVLAPRRRALHLQVADAVAIAPSADPDTVAYHLQRAGDARAAAWLVRAGEQAERAYALLTAAARYEAALALLPDDESAMRGWLHYRVARTCRYVDVPRGLAHLERATTLASQAEDRTLAAVARWSRGHLRTMADDLPGGPEELVAGADAIMALSAVERARIVVEQGGVALDRDAPHTTAMMWLAGMGEFDRVRQLAARWLMPAAHGGSRNGDAAVLADGWVGLGWTQAMRGDPEAGRASFARAIAAYEAQGNYTQVRSIFFLTLVYIVLPYATDCVEERERIAIDTMRAAQRSGHISSDVSRIRREHAVLRLLEARWDDPSFGLVGETAGRGATSGPGPPPFVALGQLHRERGRQGAAWELVHRFLPAGATTVPGAVGIGPALMFQRLAATLCLDADNLPGARGWLDAHDRWLAWSGAVLGRSEGEALWARYHRAAGATGTADRHADRALAHATAPRQPLALLAAHRLLGELATDGRRFDDALAHLQTALALADACAVPYERAVTLLASAELALATGRHADAHAALGEVRAACTPLDATLALDRADRIADRIAVAKSPPGDHPAGLSTREVEVLRLLAQGRTNPEIAAALFLSTATVRHHVAHLLAKTGADNRTAAAVYAQRHGLT